MAIKLKYKRELFRALETLLKEYENPKYSKYGVGAVIDLSISFPDSNDKIYEWDGYSIKQKGKV